MSRAHRTIRDVRGMDAAAQAPIQPGDDAMDLDAKPAESADEDVEEGVKPDDVERFVPRDGTLPFLAMIGVMVPLLVLAIVRGNLAIVLPGLAGTALIVVVCARLVERALHSTLPLDDLYLRHLEGESR